MKITTIQIKFWGSFPFFARVIDPIYTPSTPQEIQEIKLLKGTSFPKPSFLGSMLVFQAVLHLCLKSCECCPAESTWQTV